METVSQPLDKEIALNTTLFILLFTDFKNFRFSEGILENMEQEKVG